MGLWNWLKESFAAESLQSPSRDLPSEQPVALVLLLREPREIDADFLCGLAYEALGQRFTHGSLSPSDGFVTGDSPSFVLKFGHRFFMVNCFAQPYLEDPEEAAEAIAELRLRKAVRDHVAWISVDLVGRCLPDAGADAYQTIGKLIAELANDNCLAIFAPATSQLMVYDPEMVDRLRGSDPLRLFDQPQHPPVVPVSANDPRLKAAVAKARRQWAKFVAAFEERRPGQTFSVKARIGAADDWEFMWITVTGLENGVIYGRLDNDPVELTSICCGDRVRVAVKELNDWLYTDGDDVQGGFTIAVLRKIQEELQRE